MLPIANKKTLLTRSSKNLLAGKLVKSAKKMGMLSSKVSLAPIPHLLRGVKPEDPSYGIPYKDARPSTSDKVRGWTGSPYALRKSK